MFSSKIYIYINKPSKVLLALTKLLFTDKVIRIDGTSVGYLYWKDDSIGHAKVPLGQYRYRHLSLSSCRNWTLIGHLNINSV
jgi:hypothetical protein